MTFEELKEHLEKFRDASGTLQDHKDRHALFCDQIRLQLSEYLANTCIILMTASKLKILHEPEVRQDADRALVQMNNIQKRIKKS